MKLGARIGLPLVASGLAASIAVNSGAQDIGGQGAQSSGTDSNNASAPGSTVTTTTQGNTINVTGNFGAPTTSTTTTYTPMGLPAPGTNPDAHLPSSSRSSTDASRSADGFDLLPSATTGGMMKGNADSAAVLGKHPTSAPTLHQVRRGDTLWDLCNGYFQNPWLWPKVWSYNPQIQNPHWIYPGDQVRLRMDTPAGTPEQQSSIVLGQGRSRQIPIAGSNGFINRRPLVPRDTVFLRSAGYIDDPKKEVWGELIGSEEEQMLLTQGNTVYVMMRPGVDLRLGQMLTVFHGVRTPARVPGARRPPGEIVAFKGTVKVEDWNPQTRIARARLIESLDAVERGDKIGPIARRFDVVPPRRNDVDVEARVLTSIYPHEIIGQNQVAFIDRGAKDGLEAGNRLFLVRRGDAWRKTLTTANRMQRTRVRTDVPEHVEIETTPLVGKPEDFPEEVTGELRILRADEYSSVALVVATEREIEPGDRAVARKGY